MWLASQAQAAVELQEWWILSLGLQALDLKMFLLGGVNQGGSMVDVSSLAGMIDQVSLLTCLSSGASLLVQHHVFPKRAICNLCTSMLPQHMSAVPTAAHNAVFACSSWCVT